MTTHDEKHKIKLGLAVTTGLRGRRDTGPVETGSKILITGAAGVAGTVIARQLSKEYKLTGLDLKPVKETSNWFKTVTAPLSDTVTLKELASESEAIIHLAHGVPGGWEGLMETDINGTKNIIDASLDGPCKRIILASTNHTIGWSEIDQLQNKEVELPVSPYSMVRPDGTYGAAKLAMEALGRAAAEETGLGISILRIGTFRLNDNPEDAATEPGFKYIGDVNKVKERLNRTWLHHADLNQIINEELKATDTFRLRYALSDKKSRLWDPTVYTWNQPLNQEEK